MIEERGALPAEHRQFSADGTFRAAQNVLPRLKDLGVDIIWLMPIHPSWRLVQKAIRAEEAEHDTVERCVGRDDGARMEYKT
jgi:glycosidase